MRRYYCEQAQSLASINLHESLGALQNRGHFLFQPFYLFSGSQNFTSHDHQGSALTNLLVPSYIASQSELVLTN